MGMPTPSSGIHLMLLPKTFGTKTISGGVQAHLAQEPAKRDSVSPTSISAYSSPVPMTFTNAQGTTCGGPIRRRHLRREAQAVELFCTEDMMSMEAMVMARPSKHWRACGSVDAPIASENDATSVPTAAGSSLHPDMFKTPICSRRMERQLQRKVEPLSPCSRAAKQQQNQQARMHQDRHDQGSQARAVRERPCFTSEECVRLFPPFEALLLHSEGDSMHGESMALFPAGKLRIPGFGDQDTSRHASEYCWHVRKLQDPSFFPVDASEGPLCAEWNESAHSPDMSAQILHSPVFKYPGTFVQHARQVSILLRFIDLTFSAYGGDIGVPCFFSSLLSTEFCA